MHRKVIDFRCRIKFILVQQKQKFRIKPRNLPGFSNKEADDEKSARLDGITLDKTINETGVEVIKSLYR